MPCAYIANPPKHDTFSLEFVEQLHSRGVFWRMRGRPPGGAAGGAAGAAGAAGAPAAVVLQTTTLTRRVLEDSTRYYDTPAGDLDKRSAQPAVHSRRSSSRADHIFLNIGTSVNSLAKSVGSCLFPGGASLASACA